MSNHTDDLKSIIRYYAGSTGVGHTNLMIEGLQHYPKDHRSPVAVLVPRMANAGHIMSRANIDPKTVIFVTPGDLGPRLVGLRAPLAVDNYMIIELCQASLDEIDRAAEHWQRMYFAQQKEFAQRLESSQARAAHWEKYAASVEGRWVNKAWNWAVDVWLKVELWLHSRR